MGTHPIFESDFDCLTVNHTHIMPVTLASRALIVQKMDKQFAEDLKMRKDTTVVSKKAETVSNNLKLLQKEMRGYDSILFDLSAQARNNRKMIGTGFTVAQDHH